MEEENIYNYTCELESQQMLPLLFGVGIAMAVWCSLFLLLFVRFLPPIKLRKFRNLVKKLDFRMEIGFQKLHSNEVINDSGDEPSKSDYSLNSGLLPPSTAVAFRHPKTTAGGFATITIIFIIIFGGWISVMYLLNPTQSTITTQEISYWNTNFTGGLYIQYQSPWNTNYYNCTPTPILPLNLVLNNINVSYIGNSSEWGSICQYFYFYHINFTSDPRNSSITFNMTAVNFTFVEIGSLITDPSTGQYHSKNRNPLVSLVYDNACFEPYWGDNATSFQLQATVKQICDLTDRLCANPKSQALRIRYLNSNENSNQGIQLNFSNNLEMTYVSSPTVISMIARIFTIVGSCLAVHPILRTALLLINRKIGDRMRKVNGGRDFEAKTRSQAVGYFFLGVLLFPLYLMLPIIFLLVYRPSIEFISVLCNFCVDFVKDAFLFGNICCTLLNTLWLVPVVWAISTFFVPLEANVITLLIYLVAFIDLTAFFLLIQLCIWFPCRKRKYYDPLKSEKQEL